MIPELPVPQGGEDVQSSAEQTLITFAEITTDSEFGVQTQKNAYHYCIPHRGLTVCW